MSKSQVDRLKTLELAIVITTFQDRYQRLILENNFASTIHSL